MWSTVAGSADTGFVVWGVEGDESAVAFWSADGLEWQEITDSALLTWVGDLAANDGGFVATRVDRQPNGSVAFSLDGLTWETVRLGTSFSFWHVDSGPGGFLLAGVGRDCETVATFSTNGRDWMPVELPLQCQGVVAAEIDGRWVGVERQDEDMVVILSSDDGTTWSEVETEPPPLEWDFPSLANYPGRDALLRSPSLSSDGDTLVLAGKGIGGGVWASTDGGMTWTDAGIEQGQGGLAMAVSDFGFVGVAPQRVLVSKQWSLVG